MESSSQILDGNCLPYLGCMHHRRVKHTLIGQQFIKACNIPGTGNAVPGRKSINCHIISLAVFADLGH
jgi:hypothetical protein